MQFNKSLLQALALAAAVPSSPAWAAGGGGVAVPPTTGGTGYKQPLAKKQATARRLSGPLLSSFSLTRPRLFLYGRPARVSFRLSGRGPVRVRLKLVPDGARRPVRIIDLGERRTRVTHSVALTGLEGGTLPQGSYVLRIAGRDRRGRGLRRAPRASSHAELRFFHHRFPLTGSFSYGDGFGAPRPGHRHQGQDMSAVEGAPVVAPRGGTVAAVQYQAGGAGHYVVLDGRGEDYDYVFMHLREGSVVVAQGQQVRTGQRIGDVGSSGASSGPHLHFEIWAGPWYAGGQPIDPLPSLRAWDSWS